MLRGFQQDFPALGNQHCRERQCERPDNSMCLYSLFISHGPALGTLDGLFNVITCLRSTLEVADTLRLLAHSECRRTRVLVVTSYDGRSIVSRCTDATCLGMAATSQRGMSYTACV